jgi:hypothetical protein
MDAVNADKIADGTIQNQDVSGSISNDKLANSSFTINGTSVSLGASQSIITYLDWQAVQVADGSTQVNAESGKGYFLDTNAGVIEVFLPTSPSRGDVVGLVDYAGTFGTNQLIINTGGINIDSTVGSEFKVTTNNAIVECVYVDSAKGWLIYLNQAAGTTPTGITTGGGFYDGGLISATGGTITTSGDFKIHTFTGDGCFVVSSGGGPLATVDYLVVAGGGGGGNSNHGGGSGAGGFRESHSVPVSGCYSASPLATPTGISLTPGSYPITVGGGGAGGGVGNNGSNSSFSTITSAGGGKGGRGVSAGVSGGSGGGGMSEVPGGLSGGSGNTPPVSPPQGNNGGAGHPNRGAAGGGGATAAGTNGFNTDGGPGGAGATTSISASPTIYAGGGGGGTETGTNGSGGPGGGGGGGPGTCSAGVGRPGTANTGGGGGGGSRGPGVSGDYDGGSGGKGIVIIRYKFQ